MDAVRSGIIVPPRGKTPNLVALIGEAPGKQEAHMRAPFVGRSGQEQEAYLSKYGVSARNWYIDNVIREYTDGNPDPTPEQQREWSPVIENAIKECNPKLIVAVGRYAARWFLGSGVDMEVVHGLPHRGGAFDPKIAHRAGSACVVPIYHPAAGMHSPDLLGTIAWDYSQVAMIYKLVVAGRSEAIPYPKDVLAGKTSYRDVSGAEMAQLMERAAESGVVGLDTEGYPNSPWSVQISVEPGQGVVLRYGRGDFMVGIHAIQKFANEGGTFAIHNAMYDIEVCRSMGLELKRADIYDTMYASYLTRLNPQGLKALAYREHGVHMIDYEATVGDAARSKQLDYLWEVATTQWPKPTPQMVTDNAGVSRIKTARAIAKQAQTIIINCTTDKSKDIYSIWQDQDPIQRKMVAEKLGRMPRATLADLPLEKAVDYSARDADVTLRLYKSMKKRLHALGLSELMKHGMELLPVFEEMQFSGMHATRRYFLDLYDKVSEEMEDFGAYISERYYNGKPFNPGSQDQVAAVMRRRGLDSGKRTDSGKMSTSKKAIAHMKDSDDAIASVIEWRERQKIRDAFCKPVIEAIPEKHEGLYPVRCRIKITRVHTRRLASADPNFLAMPSRSELGVKVRKGFIAPPGQIFGGWDLSQIELRLLAHVSGDATMCQRFIDDVDLHTYTAAEIFKIPVEQVDKMLHRNPAKNAGFGIVYGISGMGLYDQFLMMGAKGWSPEKCDKLIEDWLKVYPGVREYKERVKRALHKDGIARDMWGMMRYLPGIWSDDRKTRSEAERTAVSHEIQGGAQGMIQNSMRWLNKRIREMQELGMNVTWALQIHDELIFRFDEELWPLMDSLVRDALTKHHGLPNPKIPIQSSGNFGASWGDLK